MEPSPPNRSRLARNLGTFDAVIIGLGSMIGAGIFVAIGPAAAAAGSWLLLGLAIAGFVALLNATSSAQLAALYPRSGGTYVYGRARLGEAWGFLAGWSFIVGKTASCAAIALTFGSYVFPDFHRAAAAVAVIVLTSINYAGIRKTALATKLIVIFVVGALLVLVIAMFAGSPQLERLTTTTGDAGWLGVLQAAGFWFFAFAGYARIATLGEEVKEPERTIPRAIPLALVIVVALYGAVAVSALLTVPLVMLASSSTPLTTAIRSTTWDFLMPVVDVAAAVATLGVLLSLLAGVARTVFEMGSNKDLPSYLDAVHPKNKVPHRAEIAVGVAVAAIVLLGDIRSSIGFSAVTVLAYYAITNAAAVTLTARERRWPRWMAVCGIVACVVVAASLPPASLLAGLLVVILGQVAFLIART
jgi:APA family basic amino acid/polyamine antiporter